MLERIRFRSWWQKPRHANESLKDRSVSFLELFYDLVYVVLIAELAHSLASHVNLTGISSFAFLFVAVWWAWFNGTIYHDLHGNNDIRTRVFTFAQMFSVAAMAVFAHNALQDGGLGESAAGFALSYACFNLILTYLWWRTGVHDKAHSVVSNPYAAAYLLTAALFIVSAFVPARLGLYLWIAALLISLLLPVYVMLLGRRNQQVQDQIDQTFGVSPSAAERFGLFNIIVLGEVVVGVVRGLSEHHHLTWGVGVIAGLGLLIGIGLWWVYFDLIAHRLPRPSQYASAAWMYLHLPLTISIAAVGAAVLNVVEHAGEPLSADVRWLLVGAIATAFIAVMLLNHTIQIADAAKSIHRTAGFATLVAAIVIIALGFTALDTLPLLGLLVLIMLMPVFFGMVVWIRRFGAAEVH